MQSPSQTFFDLLSEDVVTHGRQIAQRLRQELPESVLVKLTPHDHRRLEACLRQELNSVVWRFLTHFDNVGCHLPPGLLGYTIASNGATPHDSSSGDIRLGEQDYSDTWLDHVSSRP